MRKGESRGLPCSIHLAAAAGQGSPRAEQRARALGNAARIKAGKCQIISNRRAVRSSASSRGVQKSRVKGAEKGRGFFHAQCNCQTHSETSALATHVVRPTGQEGDFGQENNAPVTNNTLSWRILPCLVYFTLLGLLDFPYGGVRFGSPNTDVSTFVSLSCPTDERLESGDKVCVMGARSHPPASIWMSRAHSIRDAEDTQERLCFPA